jgi:hypothetical protein
LILRAAHTRLPLDEYVAADAVGAPEHPGPNEGWGEVYGTNNFALTIISIDL